MEGRGGGFVMVVSGCLGGKLQIHEYNNITTTHSKLVRAYHDIWMPLPISVNSRNIPAGMAHKFALVVGQVRERIPP